jgi:hypothetical protein
VEAFGLDAGLEAAVGQLVLVVVVVGQQFLDAVDEQLLGADDQDLVPAFAFELAQRHAVFLEELDQVLAGDAAILAAGDPVAAQSPGIEPFADRARCDFTDFRDLAGRKHFFHGRVSS